MKLNKLILIAVTLFIGISGLSACNMSNDKDGIHYYLHVEGADGICPNPPKSGWHKKGSKISFKTEIVTDLSFYVFLNSDLLDYIRSDDALGGYQYYEFSMPAQETFLTITSNRYFVDREYSFSEVLFEAREVLSCKNDIIEIKIEVEDTLKSILEVQTSNDQRDIEYNVAIIENEKLVKLAGEPSRNDYTHTAKITFFVNENLEFKIEFKPYILYRDFSSAQFFAFANPDCQGFMINYPNTDAE